ncbi:MAG TPA: hypothetical protein VFZ67_06995 [Nitrososphaera sp.]
MTSLTPAPSSPFHEQDAIIINDPLFDHKLDLITAGARTFLKEHLLNKISRENCLTIINYFLAMQTETNLSDSYRQDTIHKLKQLAEQPKHNPNNNKTFRDMTRQDVLQFLDRLRKPESVDPLHKRIDSYNLISTVLLRFFRWLYFPDISPSKEGPIPPVMENIPQTKTQGDIDIQTH